MPGSILYHHGGTNTSSENEGLVVSSWFMPKERKLL